MIFLKKSTAATLRVGPFVDATDGGTPETALTFSSGEVYLFKHTGAGAEAHALMGAHTFDGMYDMALTASETDTVGMLTINCYDSAARPVCVRAMVLPALVYDSLIGGTDALQVDVLEINGNVSSGFLSGTDHLKADVVKIGGTAGAADNLEASTLAMQKGTVSTGSTTTLIKTGLTEATNDHYNGRVIAFVTGALAGQLASITDYNGTSKDLTVSALTEAPANGDTFIII